MIHAKNIVYSTSEPDEKTGRVIITANLAIWARFASAEAVTNKDEIEKSLRFKIADVMFADAKRAPTDLYMTAWRPPLGMSDPIVASTDYLTAIQERFEAARAALTIKEED